MKKSQQSGFAVVEALLVVLLLFIIAGTAYYVWQSKQTTDNTYKTPPKASSEAVQPKSITDPLASAWVSYEAPGQEYSIRLADGWKLLRYAKEASIYTTATKDMQYQKGMPAIVTETQNGGDGATAGIFLNYHASKTDAGPAPEGTRAASLNTVQGDTVTPYVNDVAQTSTEEGGLIKGTHDYTYVVSHDSHSISFEYIVPPTLPDQHQIVETSVKTIQFLK